MSLDNPKIVDAIGTEKTTGDIILTITDSWDWADEGQHLLALQNKINAYLDFIESGEIFQKYPNAKGRKLVIDVVTRFPLPEIGVQFLEKANAACADLGVTVRNTYYPGSQNKSATNQKSVKIIYPADRRVSVWVGNFSTEDEFEKSVRSEVAKHLALPTHIESTSEFDFQKKSVPIRQLIEGFSGAKFFVDAAESRAIALGVSSANAAFVCYFVECEDAPEKWGPLHFLGTFAGQLFT